MQVELASTNTASVSCGRYRYKAYGLRIWSELPLPELRPDSGDDLPDIEVILAEAAERTNPEGEDNATCTMRYLESIFWFRGVGEFRVLGGRTIVVAPEPGVEHGLIRMYVQGMMLAALLHQRGFHVLHASAVKLGDGAVAFIGNVGAGKSTMAAALHARGYPVISDDNVAVELIGGCPVVSPAFPWVKIFPEIAESLGFTRSSLRPLHTVEAKYVREVDGGFPSHPLPLRRIYVLTRDTGEDLKRVSSGEAMLELIRNSVPTRWGQAGDAAHLEKCARIVRTTPIYRLRTFDDLDGIAPVVARVQGHPTMAEHDKGG